MIHKTRKYRPPIKYQAWFLILSSFFVSVTAQTLENLKPVRRFQIGADMTLPYKVNPLGRLATLVGAHVDYFVGPEWSLGVEVIAGVENEGFADHPVYVSPGFGFYPYTGHTFEPYLRADAPMLINNGTDYGVRGGLGVLWNVGPQWGLRYSFDVDYYFDAEITVFNLAHLSAVLNW